MLNLLKAALLVTILLAASAFATQPTPNVDVSSQPPEERAAQESLPKSTDPVWSILIKTKIHVNEKKGLYSATYPPEVKALVGKPMTVTGFMLPLEDTRTFKHFILSRRTPTCPFCPPGEPNENIDIWLDKPKAYDEHLIKITGNFALMNNAEFGMFFKLDHATLVKK